VDSFICTACCIDLVHWLLPVVYFKTGYRIANKSFIFRSYTNKQKYTYVYLIYHSDSKLGEEAFKPNDKYKLHCSCNRTIMYIGLGGGG
jgi:hypothetical protein